MKFYKGPDENRFHGSNARDSKQNGYCQHTKIPSGFVNTLESQSGHVSFPLSFRPSHVVNKRRTFFSTQAELCIALHKRETLQDGPQEPQDHSGIKMGISPENRFLVQTDRDKQKVGGQI